MKISIGIWHSSVVLFVWSVFSFSEATVEEATDYDDNFADMFHLHDYWNSDGKVDNADEVVFYFFDDHDFNGDNRLDGLELLKAMYHEEMDEIEDLPEGHPAHKHTPKTEQWRTQRMSALVDKALKLYDTNNDGYFSWHEFYLAAKTLSLVNLDA